jgi:hypothetical protein
MVEKTHEEHDRKDIEAISIQMKKIIGTMIELVAYLLVKKYREVNSKNI